MSRPLRFTDGSLLRAAHADPDLMEALKAEAQRRHEVMRACRGVQPIVPSRRRSQGRFDAAAFKTAFDEAFAGRSMPILNRAGSVRARALPQAEPALIPVDPAAPFEPVSNPGGQAQLDRVAALDLPPDCMSCQRRVTFQDNKYGLSFGYCEGCPSIERKCPSCGEHKPMVKWGYGWVEISPGFNRPGWCCPACKADADHPLSPRFACTLDVDDLTRHLLVAELVKAPGAAFGGYMPALSRIVEALRVSGEIDIDLADLDQDQRDATSVVLSNVAAQVGPLARDAADRLYRRWVAVVFVDKRKVHAPVRPLTEAEQSALVHGERPL
jgi:hypothetical protein